ncbi:sensor histidine kinase [Magnetospirillum moscoviense]|uniref:sensor histidine kinase n=1 Tax=Magnetospirillum moscoviense TaxID=1437059 RepID=UPI000A97A5F8|nr:ATP-binding protein [Magnetospirillum moscoviense]
MPFRLSRGAAAALLFAAYIATAIGGMTLASLPPGNLTVFWLPAGIGVAVLLVLGRRGTVVVAAASFTANGLMMGDQGQVLLATALSAAVDSLQSWLGWSLLRRHWDNLVGAPVHDPRRLRGLASICLIPPLATVWLLPLIHDLARTAGPLTLHAFLERTLMLLLADTSGLFLVVPVVVGFSAGWPAMRLPAALALLAVAQVAVSAIDPLLAPLALLGLALMAFIFQFPGAAAGNLVCATVMVVQAAFDLGPLRGQGTAQAIVVLNLTIVGVGIAVLYMGLLQDEQHRMRATLRDEVERRTRQLEERSRALAASNGELEQFAYIISHDLRQPLRMIASYVKLLDTRLKERLAADEQDFFEYVRSGASRMDQMLVSLLEYSRVGRSGEPMVETDCRAQLDEALQYLEPAIQDAQAEIRIEGVWPILTASPNEMVRLFQNLIGNAVKYRVADRAPLITVSARPTDGGWRFAVSDNGIGIDADQFDRLFKVFQRLHPAKYADGAGVGLAVCRKIVERHGGRIEVDSQPGQGSTFAFTLP